MCFNPTRVHLERVVYGHVADEIASTQRGCIWNVALDACEGLDSAASTQRGCIWNRLSDRDLGLILEGFNPTRVHLEQLDPSASSARLWLQPNEGASGTGCLPSLGRRRSCFNPTRVHLERRIWMPSLFDDQRFNPTRVHLEPSDWVFRGYIGGASTQRGCIWNHVRPIWPICCSELQPNEGASGTGAKTSMVRSASSFNPTRVHLEPFSLFDVNFGDTVLQPNEGASGTPPICRLHPSLDASTQRGCIWNSCDFGKSDVYARLQPNEGASGTDLREAALQVFNELQPNEGASGTTVLPVVSLAMTCFNPTRVHLERLQNGRHEQTAPSFNPTRVHLER